MSSLNMYFKAPFEAKLLLIACLILILMGCGSGESTTSSSDSTLSLEASRVSEYPIVYVKRDVTESVANLVDLDAFSPGAELFVRATPNNNAQESNISAQLFGVDARYDVRDINISYDGLLMVFAARGPFVDNLEDGEEQPSVWNLYEYDFVTGDVYPVMNDEAAGVGHDITPHYLADGRLIFSSSRQTRTSDIMKDEGKPEYVYQVEVDDDDERFGPGFALHLAEFDSNRNLFNIKQVTFNQSHDFDPVLRANGKIVFSRWDAAGDRDQVSFYQMNPDGAELEILYGYNSHDSIEEGAEVQFSNPQVTPDGQLIAVLRGFEEEGVTPDIVKIDIANFVDYDVSFNGTTGTGVSAITKFETTSDPNVIPEGGRFSNIWPLNDGTDRAIVSWSFCRLLNDNGTVRSCNGVDLTAPDLIEAPANYGLWLFDFEEDTQVPLILGDQSGRGFYELAIAEPRETPSLIRDVDINLATVDDSACARGFFTENDGFGMVHIRSVYDIDGTLNTAWVPEGVTTIAQLSDPVAVTADQRAARFVRFEKPVYIPDPEIKDIPGRVTANTGPFMREILGYAPVQPDGSIKVKMPADIPFMLTIVDQYGRELSGLSEHVNWLQVRPGEVMECNGCHDADSDAYHSRRDARPESINAGAISQSMFANTNPEVYEDGASNCLPNAGDTMAEVLVRADTSRADLTPDIVFEDVWTDPDQRTPDASFTYSYASIQTIYDLGNDIDNDFSGVLPMNRGECSTQWNSACRIVINYEDHIQPLWEVPRTVTTDDGVETYSCIDCHSANNVDDDGATIPPAALLTLTSEMVDNVMRSYSELVQNNANVAAIIPDGEGGFITASQLPAQDMNGDIIAALEKWDDGSDIDNPDYFYCMNNEYLVPIEVDVFETEIVQDPETLENITVFVRDVDGHPRPLNFSISEADLGYTSVRINRGGARSGVSSNFGELFTTTYTYSRGNACGTNQDLGTRPIEFDHSNPGLFSESELKLIWEWLDIGSAYYNSPFDVPD